MLHLLLAVIYLSFISLGLPDAVLGAAALGDIGKHFPDTDPAYKGADSLALTREVAAILTRHGYKLGNIDATLLCQAPKLAPHIPAMRQNICPVCRKRDQTRADCLESR